MSDLVIAVVYLGVVFVPSIVASRAVGGLFSRPDHARALAE